MPIDFSIEHQQRHIVVRYWGVIQDQELVAAWRSFLRDKGWIPGYGQLADLSEADFSQTSADGIKQLASFIESSYRKAKVPTKSDPTAVYAPGDLTYGFARMWAAMVDGTPQQVALFRDLDEAKQWLAEINGSPEAVGGENVPGRS